MSGVATAAGMSPVGAAFAVGGAILGAIQKKGMTAFQDVFTDTVKSAFDKITGRYGTLQSTSDKINEQGDKYTSNVDKYNAVVAEMEPLIAEQNKLYDKTQDPEAAIIEAAKNNFWTKYNFPPYSTGEARRIGTGRRELGHGALAE